MRRVLAIIAGLWLLRRSGVHVGVTPAIAPAAAAPASAPLPVSTDVAQIVNLMVADPEIGLVLQVNQPGEPLQGVRMNGPGGRA